VISSLTEILNFTAAALLVVYVIAEGRYLTTVYFQLLFIVLSMAVAVLSYLYFDLTSLAISSMVFLLSTIRIIRAVKVIQRWRRGSTG